MPATNPIYTGSGPEQVNNDSDQLQNLGSLTTGDLFGGSTSTPFNTTKVPSVFDGLDLGSFSSSNDSAIAPATPQTGIGAPSALAGDTDWSALLPYLASGAIGIGGAAAAQHESSGLSGQVSALGQPFTNTSNGLLAQYQSGQLRPDQQNVVDAYNTASGAITAGSGPLSQIAQQAFENYNAGRLSPGQEAQLAAQTAAQKQAVRSRLAQSGISDSSVLDAQDQAIDQQALVSRQKLLDAQFATGNTAYDSWLRTTTAGQQLQIQGQQFASQSFEQMLNDALGLGSAGMQPAMQAIQMQIQSDAQLSQTVSSLLGNLASAYSYSQAGAQGSGGKSTTAQLQQIISGVKTGTNAANTISNYFDDGLSSGWASGANLNTAVEQQLGDVGSDFDLSSFNGAGGQAATAASSPTSTGITSATAAAGQQPSLLSQANRYAGIAGNVLGVYNGLEQGGVRGYGGAAVNATQLASKAGLVSSGVGAAAGYVAAPLAVYSAVKDYESGDTTGDTMRGAAAGAAIGSVVPVIGTAIGAVVGAAIGALSSAFGPGKKSIGSTAWEQYQKSDMTKPGTDLSVPQFEESWLGAWQSDNNRKYLDTFTKMSVNSPNSHGGDPEVFKGWIVDQLADGIKAGQIKPGMTSAQIYQNVITPAMDQYWKQTGSTMTSAQWAQQSAQGKLQLPQMIQATIDRAMTGEQIDRHSENYKGEGAKYADIPSLTELLHA